MNAGPPRMILAFAEVADEDVDLVGGKGLSLAQLTRAGFPVPPGFCITTTALPRTTDDDAFELSAELRELIRAAYRDLGGGAVAVRSSATREDSEAASFAGQQETFLEITGEEAVLDAVNRCVRSLDSERARAYRRKQGIRDADVTMSVVVQRMVAADVAGVLFTRDPLDPTGKNMLVEAARGLGEAVVSGRVMPDLFRTNRETGAVVNQECRGAAPVLSPESLMELTKLGRRVEEHFGAARDVEWAFADEKFYLLQARPITTTDAFERETFRRNEVRRLQARAEKTGTVWARYNLAETLPEPTPLTWSIVRRMVSSAGGLGAMYRDLGFDPDPALDDGGAYDLICGRPFVNLSREPQMYFRDFPYGHEFAKLKSDPSSAAYPTPTVVGALATGRTWLRLPAIAWKMICAPGKMQRARKAAFDGLGNRKFPELREKIATERGRKFTGLPPDDLAAAVLARVSLACEVVAAETLKPAMFAAAALAELEAALTPLCADADAARNKARSLVLGVHPPPDDDLPRALESLAAGAISREDFVRRFGHRGAGEMELAKPRWSEASETLPSHAGTATTHAGKTESESQSELQRLMAEKNAAPAVLESAGGALRDARRFLALREEGKNVFMTAYSAIRPVVLEVGARTGLGGDVFFLTLEEIPRVLRGDDLRPTIAVRKRERSLALSLAAPTVIFSDDLEAIGRPAEIAGGSRRRGTPLSFGEYTGPALVLEEPISADNLEPGYVLVCPTTDPAWVPLFLRAGALVMETGGVLSHGAIVAREFGLPAVAGLPNIHRELKTGQRVFVDGGGGVIYLPDE